MPRKAMGLVHIVLGLPTRVPDVIIRLVAIANAMEKNVALFPKPPISIPTFRKRIDALTAAQVATTFRTVGLVAKRNAALGAAKLAAGSLCTYVNGIAVKSPDSAPTLAAAAGMVLRRFGGRTARWMECATLAGDVVQVNAPVLRGAVAYEWIYSISAGQTWIALPTTSRASCRITGLEAPMTIMVRVRAITRKGPTNWSTPYVFIVGTKKRR